MYPNDDPPARQSPSAPLSDSPQSAAGPEPEFELEVPGPGSAEGTHFAKYPLITAGRGFILIGTPRDVPTAPTEHSSCGVKTGGTALALLPAPASVMPAHENAPTPEFDIRLPLADLIRTMGLVRLPNDAASSSQFQRRQKVKSAEGGNAQAAALFFTLIGSCLHIRCRKGAVQLEAAVEVETAGAIEPVTIELEPDQAGRFHQHGRSWPAEQFDRTTRTGHATVCRLRFYGERSTLRFDFHLSRIEIECRAAETLAPLERVSKDRPVRTPVVASAVSGALRRILRISDSKSGERAKAGDPRRSVSLAKGEMRGGTVHGLCLSKSPHFADLSFDIDRRDAKILADVLRRLTEFRVGQSDRALDFDDGRLVITVAEAERPFEDVSSILSRFDFDGGWAVQATDFVTDAILVSVIEPKEIDSRPTAATIVPREVENGFELVVRSIGRSGGRFQSRRLARPFGGACREAPVVLAVTTLFQVMPLHWSAGTVTLHFIPQGLALRVLENGEETTYILPALNDQPLPGLDPVLGGGR